MIAIFHLRQSAICYNYFTWSLFILCMDTLRSPLPLIVYLWMVIYCLVSGVVFFSPAANRRVQDVMTNWVFYEEESFHQGTSYCIIFIDIARIAFDEGNYWVRFLQCAWYEGTFNVTLTGIKYIVGNKSLWGTRWTINIHIG